MILIRKYIHPLLALLLVAAPALYADFDADVLPEKLAATTKEFLSTDTGKARAQMPTFGDDDLQRIATAFKKSHSKEEQRLFWLVEEFYRRNAERVAAERIRYLYYAVLAALGVIALFSALTYRRSRRLGQGAPTAAVATPTAIATPTTAKAVAPKKSKAKGKRK
ncbi:MAG: hypothetical protein JSR44_00995 [Spirochaetes bacterium]|nr:hypothetical protein [Spirochaetota bacterium]